MDIRKPLDIAPGRYDGPKTREKPKGFKVRKFPVFFACVSLVFLIATPVSGFMAASWYASFFWVPFFSAGMFILSILALRISVFRYNVSRRASQRKKNYSERHNSPDVEVAPVASAQEVFDAQDVVHGSPFTIEQLREVALSVAAESEGSTEDKQQWQWTPVDLPKPLYTETSKARRHVVAEEPEKVDYKSESTIKKTVARVAESGNVAAGESLQTHGESASQTTRQAEEDDHSGDAITNLDDVLQRRRAF